jgi:hypothetical protein
MKLPRSDPISRHAQKEMTIPLPWCIIFPGVQTFSGEKISMRVNGICCLAHIFHLDMQEHSIEYRNTEQLRSNYSLAQSPEE